MELLYNVKDRPSPGKIIVFALQQLLSILAGTVTVPIIVGNGMSQSAALIGASVGTLLYLVLTKFRSPVFLGSSFTYLGSMSAAFAGAMTTAIGYIGLLIGAALAGLVYVILSIIIHFTGSKWVDKVFPPIIIGPTVAVIGLVLSPNAINNISKGNVLVDGVSIANPYLCLLVGLVTLVVAIICSVYGKKMIKLIPFIVGIGAGYLLALIFTLIGNGANINALKIIDFEPIIHMKWLPDFAFLKVFEGAKDFANPNEFWKYFSFIAVSYVPVAFAVFAEHIADHKNISYIININLLEDPGLSRTLMGDGVGSIIGAVIGGCPNTTYGESISCLAFSRNASIITIVVASVIAIIVAFIAPVMAVLASIPACVIGGLSIALYGFIASSGLRMLKQVDLTEPKNIFVIATIFVFGIGGMVLQFKYFEVSPVACALIGGLSINLLVNIPTKKNNKEETNKPNQEE